MVPFVRSKNENEVDNHKKNKGKMRHFILTLRYQPIHCIRPIQPIVPHG